MTVTEHELKERAVAPRVTLEQVNSVIASEHYFTAGQGAAAVEEKRRFEACALTGNAVGTPIPAALDLLTMSTLVLSNGFTVHGVSACADPANYKKDIGERIAKQDAVNKIWPLLGYELKTKLALVEAAGPVTGELAESPETQTYIGTKVVHARPMNRLAYNILRGWQLPADENGFDEGYLVQYADGGEVNLEGYTGYVSWSPKDVFERSYATPGASPQAKPSEETWVDRAKVEHRELLARLQKLDAFTRSPAVDALSINDYADLKTQREGMSLYLDALTSRLRRAGVVI